MSEKFRNRLLSQLFAQASHETSDEFLALARMHGFTARQWRLLGSLWDEESLTLKELSEIILCKQSTTTRLVERSHELGLVAKRGDAEDGRKTHVSLTAAGRERVRPLIEAAAANEDRIDALLGPGRVAALREEVEALVRDLRAARAIAEAGEATRRRSAS